jgi:hypothetical protein
MLRSRQSFLRLWRLSTATYFVAGLLVAGMETDWTWRGSMSPLAVILASPIFLSAGVYAVCTGDVKYVVEFHRAKNPVSFWVITACLLFLGCFLLVWGIRGLWR